jgi:hypothetical protein
MRRVSLLIIKEAMRFLIVSNESPLEALNCDLTLLILLTISTEIYIEGLTSCVPLIQNG